MKTKKLKYFLITALIMACSTEKDALVNRSFHGTTTKYNVLYNGNLALEAGLQDLALTPDNFWEILPVERMQIIEPIFGQDSVVRNANFVRAEDKAVKAIEKHSMNIANVERNPEMDEAYLLLGKARYYDQRFIPALEAFNFILYKYPHTDKVGELKFWKEKTNVRLDNNQAAIKTLSEILENILSKEGIEKDVLLQPKAKKVKDNQLLADVSATMAQAYLNEELYDEAIIQLTIARNQTSIDDQKARYSFILGQLLEKQNRKKEAASVFHEIIKMNRRSPREYVIHSYAKIGSFEITDSLEFIKKFNNLLEDRENRQYLDVLHHQIALFYDKSEHDNQAISHYNKSLKHKSVDVYRVASNYRNIAEIHFYNAKYSLAGKYYDSTLAHLNNKTREFRHIKRKRENLEDVIKYEAIAVKNDSILSLVRMSEAERNAFFGKYVDKLKKEAERQRKESEKSNWQDTGYISEIQSPSFERGQIMKMDGVSTDLGKKSALAANSGNTAGGSSSFYFYNPNVLAQGKTEFRKRWGNRTFKDYWRLSNYMGSSMAFNETEEIELDQDGNPIVTDKKQVNPLFTTEFYTRKIPTDLALIDSLQKERNFAYYQLGMIYKDKFKEYELALSKLENLLESNPEERLILPTMYNLYRIYEVLGWTDKMADMKSQINTKYPDSRYAQIINNPNAVIALEGLADAMYKAIFEIYESGDYRLLLTEIEPLIEQYSGEAIISKLELLKANALGNLGGLNEYKKALNYVALTYPNSIEGKEAENLLNTNIPKLEKLDFGKNSSTSWKIIHKTTTDTDLSELNQKLDVFLNERSEKLKITLDSYTLNENFVTIHGISSEQKAKDFVMLLEEYKDYKVKEKFVPISSEDYKVIQIKKNFVVYLQRFNLTP